jgi:hypothetical protein
LRAVDGSSGVLTTRLRVRELLSAVAEPESLGRLGPASLVGREPRNQVAPCWVQPPLGQAYWDPDKSVQETVQGITCYLDPGEANDAANHPFHTRTVHGRRIAPKLRLHVGEEERRERASMARVRLAQAVAGLGATDGRCAGSSGIASKWVRTEGGARAGRGAITRSSSSADPEPGASSLTWQYL